MPKAQRHKINKGKTNSIKPKKDNDLLSNTETATINKASKKKLRHEAWLEKLDTSYNLKKKHEKKANKKGALNKGFDDFADVLNVISEDNIRDQPESSTSIKQVNDNNTKPKIISSDKIKSQKAKKKSMMQEILRFQNVMKNDAFKQDPLSAIRLHVQNSFK
ncbi:ribosome biogenesis protein SLX9-domain-containing protein [Cunninghamella echinulata]|nr:ribosome biogenesis protein SLX9-domain-containing protein [Cunninghamella echinulata]